MDWGTFIAQYPLFANQYVQAALMLLVSAAVARLFQGILIHYFHKLTQRTETDIDDVIIKISSRPLFFLILLAGAFFSAETLTVLDLYEVWVDGIFFVLAVLITSWMAARIFSFLSTRWFQEHRDVEGTPALVNIIVSVLIYLGAFIVILSYFNVEITPVVAALGVGGLAIGLALQDTLGNIFAGIHILSDQPIRVNDIVEIKGEDLVGTVEDIGWRSTRIRTFTNNLVIVPNNKIANSMLTNFQFPGDPMRCIVECGVDYGSDLEKVEKIAMKVGRKLQKEDYGDKDWEPLTRFHTFGDNNINFRMILQASNRGNTFLMIHEYMKALKKAFDKEGIEISWPVRKLYHESPLHVKKGKK